MPARRYRNTLVSALAASAVALAGCSSGSHPAPTTSTYDPVGSAGAGTAPAASLSPVPTGQSIAGAKVAGAIRLGLGPQVSAKVRTRVVGGIGASDTTAQGGDGALTGTETSLRTQLDVRQGGQTLRVISTPDTVYIRGLLGGTTWARTTSGLSGTTTTLGGQFRAQTDLANPWRTLPALTAATSVLSVGPTTLKGTPVSSYKLTLRPQDSFGLLSPEQRTPDLKKAFQQLKTVLTVSLDRSGHPLRVVTRVSGTATVGGSRQRIDQTTTVTYSAWGSSVDIATPRSARNLDA
ncbi:hypothetical protein ACIB24_13560 [Spongisporangium articulatum]|uniref:Lipoprotein n=1 Tax=Spongisporangium articulatum TaxID=3362603 RepID=A0ABW8ANY1_9ACTN